MSTLEVEPTHRIRHPYIERKTGICGGKPVIIGTRVKITQIAIEYERLGWTPDQIIEAHPQLRLEQVHDALSFYYENQSYLDAEIIADEHYISELRKQYPGKAPSLNGN